MAAARAESVAGSGGEDLTGAAPPGDTGPPRIPRCVGPQPGAAPPLTLPLALRPKAIRRAVANLSDNALRHAGGTGPIELALDATKTGAAIEVRDRGPGIPAAEAERLKLPFTRLETARTNAMGTGLGLAIVDRIARGHGGTLDLLPRAGGGLIARIGLAKSAPPS